MNQDFDEVDGKANQITAKLINGWILSVGKVSEGHSKWAGNNKAHHGKTVEMI